MTTLEQLYRDHTTLMQDQDRLKQNLLRTTGGLRLGLISQINGLARKIDQLEVRIIEEVAR